MSALHTVQTAGSGIDFCYTRQRMHPSWVRIIAQLLPCCLLFVVSHCTSLLFTLLELVGRHCHPVLLQKTQAVLSLQLEAFHSKQTKAKLLSAGPSSNSSTEGTQLLCKYRYICPWVGASGMQCCRCCAVQRMAAC